MVNYRRAWRREEREVPGPHACKEETEICQALPTREGIFQWMLQLENIHRLTTDKEAGGAPRRCLGRPEAWQEIRPDVGQASMPERIL